ncbi:MAG: RIP metalloprotease RseP [Paludibacteraceae bacterium]|nr:RIP metalloprotease RseP [Paludibacteraceae bacterium]
MDTLIKILQLLGSLSILVLVHEMGHFLAAKLFKVRVEKFYLFFNPWFTPIKYTSKKGDTEYGIGWLPLGGYVKLAGMVDESMDTEQLKQPVQDWEFRAKPAWQRLIIMAAGVIMNFILAMVIYASMLFYTGEEYVPLKSVSAGMSFSEMAKQNGFADGDILLQADGSPLLRLDEENFRKILNAETVLVKRANEEHTIVLPTDFAQQVIASREGFTFYRIPFVVKEVMPNTPAQAAFLQAGDSIVSLNDTILLTQEEFASQFANFQNQPILLGLYRNGELTSTTITPDSAGKIGVYVTPFYEIYPTEKINYSILQAIPAGIHKGTKKFTGYASDMKFILSKEGAESIGGFGSISQLFPTSFSWLVFFEITAYLSVILAFMNILPIPALDGGHIMFLTYEIVMRKKVSTQAMMNAQKFGLLLLLFLLLYANGMDVIRAFFS